MRVSLDNRFVRADRPIAEQMLEPHLGGHDGFTWDDCYADWESTELQYYWRDLDLHVTSQDDQWRRGAFDQAIALVRSGDDRARHYLSRIVGRDPDSADAQTARAVLENA
jgi:hypothetical protein